MKVMTIIFLFLSLNSPLFAAEHGPAQRPAPATGPAQGLAPTTDENKFLEDNKHKTDVVTLPSGLQYQVLKDGEGKSPGPTDFVTVNYRGTLIDGTEFDSTYKLAEKPTFAVNAVIPGWQEALQLMKPGSKWILYVPPKLAYGDKSVGKIIKPNSVLIFEVELLAVKPTIDVHGNVIMEDNEED